MQCSQVALHGKLHSTHIYYGLTRAIGWRGLIERLVHHEWMYGHWIHNLTGSQISYMSLVASADNSFYRWIALLLHPIIQCSRTYTMHNVLMVLHRMWKSVATSIIECLLQKKSRHHTTITTTTTTNTTDSINKMRDKEDGEKISTMLVIIVIIANSVRPIDLRRLKLRQKMNENVYNSHDKNKKEFQVCVCAREKGNWY